MSVSAVLFDVDGTLVDSNYVHVDAWQRSFTELGERVDAWRIHQAIGQDSARLLRSLVGDRDGDWVSRAKELHSTYYRESAPRLRAFDHAADLLQVLSHRGAGVVLATSAPSDELDLLMHALDAGDAVAASTSADDVDDAKPDPSILEVALERIGASAADAIMVGDSIWDMKAAERAGLRSVGLLAGGSGAAELRDAGASRVLDDPAALLAQLDDWF